MTTKANSKKEKKIPYHYKPENMDYDEWQIALRHQFAKSQDFKFKNIGEHKVFSDYEVFNKVSQKTYKVALRSKEIGLNFCNCADFRINDLGTCKHIEFLLEKLLNKRGIKRIFNSDYEADYSSLSLKYGQNRKVYLRIGENYRKEISDLAKEYFNDENILPEDNYHKFDEFTKKSKKIDQDFRIYEDVTSFVKEYLEKKQRIKFIEENNFDKELSNLLKVDLFDHQKEAILFLAKAGRVLLADDMGLGKTIQAIGFAKFMSNHFDVKKVLIVCPTSLKYQWQGEINKFSNQSVQVIEGARLKRKKQYEEDKFFKITGYHVIHNDLDLIDEWQPDLIILDEGQKIKNWKTRISKKTNEIKTKYALILTGTPLENKLEELYNIISFIDPYRLGPLFRFLNKHNIVTTDTNKVIGYKDLNKISEALSDIMLRRTKEKILKNLPKKSEKYICVPFTKQQKIAHDEDLRQTKEIASKWAKKRYLTEDEKEHLMICLNRMRMVCNSTYILDQDTRYDTKIDELVNFLRKIFKKDKKIKIVIFTSWEKMGDLISNELDKMNIIHEYLSGSVPSKNRQKLLDNFQNNLNSRVFLSTDAGNSGLNLQNAKMLINMDPPWNPAILEQRIARIYRIGQKSNISVIHFITEKSFEQRLLELISFKKLIFKGVMDNGDNEVHVSNTGFDGFMDDILEITKSNKRSNFRKFTKKISNIFSNSNEKETDCGVNDNEVSDVKYHSQKSNFLSIRNRLFSSILSFFRKTNN